jgi:transposase
MGAFYAGLDVSDKSTAVCVIDAAGVVVSEASVETEPVAIARALKPYRRVLSRVAHESGAKAPWLQKELVRRRFPIVCLDARAASGVLAAQRNKTDKNDARALAQLVRTGWYSPAHTKSDESFRMRLLLTHRRQLMRKAQAIDLCLRGSLKVFGGYIEKKERVKLPAKKRDAMIEGLGDAMVRARNAITKEVKKLDVQVQTCAKRDPVCRRFMAIPGVGPITALTYRAAVDDPRRFSNSRNVAAHFGLTPRRYQSGETDIRGRISKRGDRSVRTALYEAAMVMLTVSKSPCALRQWGLRLRKEKGVRIAAVAVARKLAVVMHRMWITNRDFEAMPAN